MPFSQQTILPASAQDVYYRDEIGNISTSHLQVLDDSVEVEIRPRFPLFGGWKTHYIIGYNLPSYEYLYTLGELIYHNTTNTDGETFISSYVLKNHPKLEGQVRVIIKKKQCLAQGPPQHCSRYRHIPPNH